tara:strand:- start:934 stop:2082 length:1149 start_codon:yes stop_codon:yes gene_type:complete
LEFFLAGSGKFAPIITIDVATAPVEEVNATTGEYILYADAEADSTDVINLASADSAITEYDPSEENMTAYFQTQESYTQCDCPGLRSSFVKNSYDIYEITTELQENSSEISIITTTISTYNGRNGDVHEIQVADAYDFKSGDFVNINSDHQLVQIISVDDDIIKFTSQNTQAISSNTILKNRSRFKIKEDDVDKFVTGCSVSIGEEVYENVECDETDFTIKLNGSDTLPPSISNGDAVSNSTDGHYVKITTNAPHTYVQDQLVVFDVTCRGKTWIIKKIASDDEPQSFYIKPSDTTDSISFTNESNTKLIRSPGTVSLNQESRSLDRVDLTIPSVNRIIEFGNVGDDTTAVNTDGYAFGSTNVFGHKRLDYVKVKWSSFLDE